MSSAKGSRLAPSVHLTLLASLFLLSSPAAAGSIAITGSVVVGNGSGLRGMHVELVPLPRPYERRALDLAGRSQPEPVAAATTGDDGRFRLVAPDPGMWQVLVGRHATVGIALAPLVEPLELPPVVPSLDIPMPVRLEDEAGRPLAGARARAEPAAERPEAKKSAPVISSSPEDIPRWKTGSGHASSAGVPPFQASEAAPE